jgi:hypothetical protein
MIRTKTLEHKGLGVVVNGHYRLKATHWVLTEWQVISTYQGRTTVGDWHKVHGNQRKNIGALRLSVPESEYITYFGS